MFRKSGDSNVYPHRDFAGNVNISSAAVDVTGLVNFLTSHPTPVRIAWYFTLVVPWPEGAASTAIVTADEAGALSIRGQFGSTDLTPIIANNRSIFCEHPIATCIRLMQEQTFSTTQAHDAEDGYGQASIPISIAPEPKWLCVPMRSNYGSLGAVCVAFDTPVFVESRSFAWLQAYVSVVGLYMQLMGYTSSGDGVKANPELGTLSIVADDAGGVDDFGFTPRQRRVLQLVAEHMTNRQIGEHLEYSESTIRQDTIAIYRLLGVVGRRSAIDRARSLGLI